ncbi:MAG TPA: biopolymer transporter ExbD [Oscillatoriaceae cyanobacterium M33_DOE_052]|uniref:Biopolymer transporter ExbD n=1 Tax=Planktothricoides sp. SpSt-374 TaxID=2282167 RepID=A0A7C3ZLC2_9CYAN|nr:biopolymer transporter ExbD [Oscillatoriaceae cyanobacterium M33_DOE_052]
MKINQDLPAEEARIELIPLIDVIFCILTFFILAALQLTRQPVIDVSLPQASTGAPQVRDMWIVRVDSFGRIFLYIEQAPVLVKLSEIAGVLQRYPRLANMIVLYADKDARYNDVLQVLDKLREVGGSRVALATNPTTNESQTPPPGTIPGDGNFNPAPSNPLTPGILPGDGNFNSAPSNPVPVPAPNPAN